MKTKCFMSGFWQVSKLHSKRASSLRKITAQVSFIKSVSSLLAFGFGGTGMDLAAVGFPLLPPLASLDLGLEATIALNPACRLATAQEPTLPKWLNGSIVGMNSYKLCKYK